MENLSPEANEIVSLLKKKEKMVAMLAPSFVVDFDYPDIIGMLKRLGFKYVVEVARGAVETNKQLLALVKLHPERRYITNPCPTVVRLIKNKYPHLVQYLSPIDSPMAATARLVDKKYPKHKKVFIGPCLLKKMEAKEDRKELDILVITYKELKDIFEIKKILPKKKDRSEKFDIIAPETRLYPISGGLSQSSNLSKKFTDAEYDVVSSPKLVEKALQDFPHRTDLKILDILNCDGGCISGPGVVSKDPIDIKRHKVIEYWHKLAE